MKVMRKMEKKEIKIVALALASSLMLVCIVAASPDSTPCFIDPTSGNYTQEQDFTWGVLTINPCSPVSPLKFTVFIHK